MLKTMLVTLGLTLASGLFSAPVQVIQRMPMGEVASLDSAREIVAVFSQPMVALSGNEDMAALCPIRVSPALAGRCRWRGTSTLVLELSETPKPGHEYKVRIPAGIKSQVSGDSLGQEVTWSFTSPRPRLRASAPSHDERWVDLEPAIFLAFDQKMDAAKAADYLRLEEVALGQADPELDPQALAKAGIVESLRSKLGGAGAADAAPDPKRSVPLKVRELSDQQYMEMMKEPRLAARGRSFYYQRGKDQLFVLEPGRALKPDHRYRIWILQGLPAAAGGVGTVRTQVLAFETWYTFKSLGASFSDGCSHPAGKRFPLSSARTPVWTFSNPVDAASFFEHLVITPDPPKPVGKADSDAEGDRGNEDGYYGEDGEYQGGGSNHAGPTLNGQALRLRDRARRRDDGRLVREVSVAGLRLELGVDYQFELKPGFKDAFGNALDQAVSVKGTVPDYCPDLEIPGGFSVMESQLKPWHPADALNAGSRTVSFWRFGRSEFVPALESLLRGGIDLPGSPSVKKDWSPPIERNIRARSYLDLSPALAGAKGGLIGFSVPGLHGHPIVGVDNLTDLGLTFKTGPDSTLLWVTRLSDGKPAAGVDLELRLFDNRSVWKGKSDAKGLASAPGWRGLGISSWDKGVPGMNDWERPRLYAIATSAGGDAVLGSGHNGGIEPWRFNLSYSERPEERHHRGLVFSDRGVYRPGESVKFKGVLRSLDKDDWGQSRSKELKLTLRNARGEEALQKTVTLGPRSSFSLSFDLPSDAPTGQWVLAAVQERRKLYLNAPFRVEEFKPAAFEVRVRPTRPEAIAGEEVNASLEGWYLYGAPMSGAAADWSILFQSTGFSPPGWDGFDFSQGWWQQRHHGSRQVGSGRLTLTAKGLGGFGAATKDVRMGGPFSARFEAGVTSPERQRLFGRAATLVHPSRYYVGAKLPTRVAQAGDDLDVQVVVTDTKGAAVPGVAVSGRWHRRVWKSVRRVGLHGRLTWESASVDEPMPLFSLKSGDKPVTKRLKLSKPGQYYLELTVKDGEGRENSSGAMLYVAGPGQAWWSQQDHDLIQLVADKAAYSPGDEAKILVQSPWPKAQALVSVERETVLDRWLVDLDGGAGLVKVPIKESYLPNAFVSVTLVRGRQAGKAFDDDGLDLNKPQARFGYLDLPVEPAGRRLKLAITLDRQDYRPGDRVEVGLQARDAAGGGERTELTVWAVDEGVLQLTGYQVPDLFNAFYGPRPLYMQTADTRLHVLGQRSYGEKGEARGGGGGSSLEAIDLRSNFKFLAHWSATVLTDAKGDTALSFRLPDNLSAFRVMAVAHTLKRFGKGQTRLTVSKPLMLRPSLPRFARLGDAFEGGVVVHNNSDTDAEVELQLKAPGAGLLAVEGGARRKVKVPAGKAVESLWKLTAAGLGQAVLYFRAAAQLDQAETDGLRWTLPVSVPEKMATVATSGVSEGEAREALRLPGEGVPGLGTVKASFSSSALSGLQDGISYLLDYPYGCLEQRLSRTLPVVAGAELLEAFKLAELGGQKKAAQESLNRLPDFQAGSGGYCYWPGCPQERPSPYLTAYALEVAKLAQDQGYGVPEASLQRAVRWLKSVFDERQTWGYPYSQSELFTMRAYALDALSLYGEAPVGYLTQLYSRRDQLPFLAKAHLLKASAKLKADESVSATLAQELLNQAKIAPRSIHFEEPENERWPWVHGSSVKATAVCVEALSAARGGFVGDEKAIAWLTGERRDKGRWRSTQENAWGLRAFNAFYRLREALVPDFKAGLFMGGNATALWSRDFKGRSLAVETKSFSVEDFFGGKPEAKLRVAKEGEGRLYYGLTMTYMPQRFDKPAFEGFEIERQLRDLQGEARSGPLKAGERYVVRLTVRSRQDRTFVALVDPLPGGLEAVNTAFATESQSQAGQMAGQSQGRTWYSGFQHSEKYDDRVQVFANFLGKGEHHYDYMVQATTPGSFSQPAAWVEQMYEPEVFGRTASQAVEVSLRP
jgi:alpha-2-macroglobulin